MPDKLTLSFPHLPDRSFDVTPDQAITAGRSDSCALHLSEYFRESSNIISRQHFKVCYENGEFWAIDLGSLCGTWLNGYPLTPNVKYRLSDQDRIQIAGYRHLVIHVCLERDKQKTHPFPIHPTLAPLLHELRESKDVLLLGVAGTGKTTLLRKLADASQAPTAQSLPLCLYVNCMAVDDYLLPSLARLLVAATKPAFDEWPATVRQHYELLCSPNCSVLNVTTALVETMQTVQRHSQKQVVLLLDQFDDVYRQLPPSLFVVLQGLKMQPLPRIQYVLTMRSEFKEDNRFIHQFLRVLPGRYDYWMPPLNLNELDRIVSVHALDETQSKVSIALGARQPRLTDLVAAGLKRLPDTAEIGPIEQLLEDDSIATHCKEMWHSLPPEEQQVLRLAAAGRHVPDSAALNRLRKDKWLLGGEAPTYTFASPLFGAFVVSLEPEEPQSGLRFDDQTCEFVLNDQHIPREYFSKLEFDLLQYLYRQAGKVRSHLDISENVWDYHEDLAASTDMIAQIISKLRRKLDNVSPDWGSKHITNVPRQGYKLTIN